MTLRADKNEVQIDGPWISTSYCFEKKISEDWQNVIERFQRQELTADDLEIVSEIFRALKRFPVAYILPVPKENKLNSELVSPHTFESPEKMLIAAEGLKTTAKRELLYGYQVAPFEPGSVLGEGLRWQWDHGAALAFASVQGRIHPESFLTMTRRYFFLHSAQKDAEGKLLSTTPRDEQISLDLLCQHHFLASAYRGALRPSEKSRGAQKLLCKYLEEIGDGLERSFAAGINCQEIEGTRRSSPHSMGLIRLMTYSAKQNILASVLLVDIFERCALVWMRSLANHLACSGIDQTARLVSKELQKRERVIVEDHLLELLLETGVCSFEYAREAIQIAELACVLIFPLCGRNSGEKRSLLE